ncbi:hypothetical protein AMATHDRAFT_74434 [Amanita thiersii Skay4041]|uniref:Cupredoxin n=1 Tax=Amanita thiersii Skay4041 TaxID=703135 RepID=A0A2A9NV43_9AGAR|nr:hypothetical protein AMATHDRAFT_74434 [Amanita thiersii Skay4041]
MYYFTILILTLLTFTSAKRIVITVSGNTTDDAGKVFQPQSVKANTGDVVEFEFKSGNHTATQSTFASPCIPAHNTNETINGFDSGFRNAGNGTAVTTLPVTITDPNTTIWFFDFNTCAKGGVGAININDSSLESLDGFQRNAIRLNGTDTSVGSSNSSNSSTVSIRGSTTRTGASPSQTSNETTRTVTTGLSVAFSFFILALSL